MNHRTLSILLFSCHDWVHPEVYSCTTGTVGLGGFLGASLGSCDSYSASHWKNTAAAPTASVMFDRLFSPNADIFIFWVRAVLTEWLCVVSGLCCSYPVPNFHLTCLIILDDQWMAPACGFIHSLCAHYFLGCHHLAACSGGFCFVLMCFI